jgi:hypothetical protein
MKYSKAGENIESGSSKQTKKKKRRNERNTIIGV